MLLRHARCPRSRLLLASSAAGRGVQAFVAVARHSSHASARRAQSKGSGHLTFAQHKPYSFLSPSGNPRRSALFALDLLTSKNAQKKSDQRLCQTSGDPCGLPGLACAGRLDADSTGLMLWSTDKRFIERIIGPSSRVEKECAPGPGRAARTPLHAFSRACADLVRVTGHEELSEAARDEAVGHLRNDIYLDNEPIRPAGVEWLNESQLRVTLTEGRHRQIRRMCDLVGWQATAIKRVRIGSLRLGGLNVGNWATLPEASVKALSQPQKQGAAHLHSTTPPLPETRREAMSTE